jgi:hypothetical protein
MHNNMALLLNLNLLKHVYVDNYRVIWDDCARSLVVISNSLVLICTWSSRPIYFSSGADICDNLLNSSFGSFFLTRNLHVCSSTEWRRLDELWLQSKPIKYFLFPLQVQKWASDMILSNQMRKHLLIRNMGSWGYNSSSRPLA